jgi:hypothetical protein
VKVLIDDRLLRSLLLEREPAGLRRIRRNDRLWTTGAWLYRLSQSVADPTVQGSLSGPLTELPSELQTEVTAKLVALPPEVGMMSLRELAWDMGRLVHRHRLNFLALEALAAARLAGAAICVGFGNVSPRLEAAAAVERVRFRVISA